MSRPKTYTSTQGDLICSHIALGKSLARICKENKSLPSVRTVYNWLREYKEFLQNYEIAKSDQADYLAEQIIEISDDGRNDWMSQCGDREAEIAYKINGEAIQRSRLRVDARKWVASKLKPKKYGDRIHKEYSVSEDYSQYSIEELERKLIESQQRVNNVEIANIK